jgi:hypothetical protein
MARKKKPRVKVEVIDPKPFSLEAHLDIAEEAQKFELSEERTVANAKLVETENIPQVTLTETVRSDEQIDRFRLIYAEELAKKDICPWTDDLNGSACLAKLTSPEQAIAHMRLHWMLQSFDIKTARAVAQDIEDRLFPTSERSTTFHLSIEERKEIHQTMLLRREQLEAGDS